MSSGTICRKVGFLWFLFLLLAGCRGLVLGLEKEDCGLSARMGFVEVAGDVIHHRLQLEQ